MAEQQVSEELQAEMDKINEHDNSPKVKPVERVTRSTYKKEDFAGADTAWVKCVTDRKPWSGNREMLYWRDYEIPVSDLLILEARRQVVVLSSEKAELAKLEAEEAKAAANSADESQDVPAARTQAKRR